MKLHPCCRTIAFVSLFLLSQYTEASSVRFVTYNASLYRKEAGGLVKDLQKTNCPQIQAVAAWFQNQAFFSDFPFGQYL